MGAIHMAEEDQDKGTPSLRDTIVNAVNASKTDEAATPSETKTTEGKDSGRDDQGRFTKKADKVDKEAAPVDKTPAPKRPSSWKKDYWDRFDAMDEETRNYILQREDEVARGISNYKAEADRSKPLWDAIAPFQADLDKHGLNAADLTTRLFGAHRTLSLASAPEKLQMFAQLAQQYGVPLQQLVGQPTAYDNPLIQQLNQRVNELSGNLQQMTQAQQLAAQQEVDHTIADFASQSEKYPHFDAVREKMARLLQAGLAEDLPSAYDQAVRLDPDLYDQIIEARQAEKLEKERQEKDAAAKAAKEKAGSLKTSSPGPTTVSGAPKTLRETLQAAVEQHRSGRV